MSRSSLCRKLLKKTFRGKYKESVISIIMSADDLRGVRSENFSLVLRTYDLTGWFARCSEIRSQDYAKEDGGRGVSIKLNQVKHKMFYQIS